MKLHAQLTMDSGSLKPLDVFRTLHVVFEQQGFDQREYCTLDNWRAVEQAEGFRIHGSLFSEISFGPISRYGLDLVCIDADADLADVDRLLADLVARLSAKQGFLHSADYYYWQNAEQPLEYECAGRDYSALPMAHNGLPPPLGAM